jgi:hypothetical protein
MGRRTAAAWTLTKLAPGRFGRIAIVTIRSSASEVILWDSPSSPAALADAVGSTAKTRLPLVS